MGNTHQVPTLFESDEEANISGHALEIRRWYPPNSPESPEHLRVCRMRDLTTGVDYVGKADGVLMVNLAKEAALRGRVVGPVVAARIPNAIVFSLELTDEAFAVFAANQIPEPNPFM